MPTIQYYDEHFKPPLKKDENYTPENALLYTTSTCTWDMGQHLPSHRIRIFDNHTIEMWPNKHWVYKGLPPAFPILNVKVGNMTSA